MRLNYIIHRTSPQAASDAANNLMRNLNLNDMIDSWRLDASESSIFGGVWENKVWG